MAELERLTAPHPRVRWARTGSPDPEGLAVIYWMQRAQRGRDNPALNLAIAFGNALKLPVLAVFGLTPNYPDAQRRHYRFLLEGLVDAEADLAARGVPLIVRLASPPDAVLELAKTVRPALVVGDENPLRIGMTWRETAARGLNVPFPIVDADVVVPSALFPKEEYAARTIRPKIHKLWDEYLKPVPSLTAKVRWSPSTLPRGEVVDPDALMEQLRIGGAGEVRGYLGGAAEAEKRLQRFVETRLPNYADARNEPTPYNTTELSAHLHFGHISPVTIALKARDHARDAGIAPENVDVLWEELIVRRELAINYVARNPLYDRLAGCPSWALQTLESHANDPREYLYTSEQLERGLTHDPLWNAAQTEMVLTGRMHNYLRMYWAKKILEWSPDADTAFSVCLALNDRYEMDGRDPGGYTGIAWAIGGKHDRPWPSRPIFGTVRFMSYESTRRKFQSDAYIARIRSLQQQQRRLF